MKSRHRYVVGCSIGVFDSRSRKAAAFLFVPFSVRTINGTHLFAVKDQYTLVAAIASPDGSAVTNL